MGRSLSLPPAATRQGALPWVWGRITRRSARIDLLARILTTLKAFFRGPRLARGEGIGSAALGRRPLSGDRQSPEADTIAGVTGQLGNEPWFSTCPARGTRPKTRTEPRPSPVFAALRLGPATPNHAKEIARSVAVDLTGGGKITGPIVSASLELPCPCRGPDRGVLPDPLATHRPRAQVPCFPRTEPWCTKRNHKC